MNSTNIYPGAQSFPVRNFWDAGQVVGGVYSTLAGQNSTKFNDGSSTTLSATPDDNIFFGYAEPFDELNWTLTTVAAGGWTGVLEYVSAVDANNIPTAWTPMTLISDTTSGLTASGKMHFFPFPATPAWVKSLNPAGADPANGEQGSLTQPGYYMRLRTTHTGTPPTTTLLLLAHYTGQGNVIASGSIPVFDSSTADTDGDGYLSDAEFANHAAGENARFYYQSRLPARYGTNVWDANFGFSSRRGQCIMPMCITANDDGFFMDNSAVITPRFTGSTTVEDVSQYEANYGAMLNAIWRSLPDRERFSLPHSQHGFQSTGIYSEAVPRRVPANTFPRLR